jgi:hypothetical protein
MKSKINLLDDELVKGYIAGEYGLCEGEGLEDAFKKWKSLPKEKRTERKLAFICDSIANFFFDPYEPPKWLPVV